MRGRVPEQVRSGALDAVAEGAMRSRMPPLAQEGAAEVARDGRGAGRGERGAGRLPYGHQKEQEDGHGDGEEDEEEEGEEEEGVVEEGRRQENPRADATGQEKKIWEFVFGGRR